MDRVEDHAHHVGQDFTSQAWEVKHAQAAPRILFRIRAVPPQALACVLPGSLAQVEGFALRVLLENLRIHQEMQSALIARPASTRAELPQCLTVRAQAAPRIPARHREVGKLPIARVR